MTVGQATVYRICAAFALAGAALFIWGQLTPVYVDNAAAYALLANDCDGAGNVSPHWHERMDALRTMRWPLMNSGGAVLLLSGCVAALAAWNERQTGQWCMTPTKRRCFLLLGIIGLAIAWSGEVFAIGLEMHRRFLPTCADSPGIPLFGITSAFILITVVGLAAGFLLATRFAPLPVPLLAWNAARTTRSLLVSVAFAPILAVLAMVLVDGARFESFLATPGYAILLFVAEATRFALVSKPRTAKT